MTERVARLRDDTRISFEVVEPSGDQIGHSYYPDLYGTTNSNPRLVVVMELSDSLVENPRMTEFVPDGVAVLVTAPRRDPTSSALVAASLPRVVPQVPRVYVTGGTIDEWRLSVPGEVAPVWLARTIATESSVPISLAQLNAARLGFGRRDRLLRTALEMGQPAARLEATSLTTLQEAVTSLATGLEGLDRTAPRAEETTYLILPLSVPPIASTTVVSEAALVWSIVVTAALLLLYAVSRPKRVKRYLRAIGHNAAAIVGQFGVLVLSLMAGNLLLRIVANVPNLAPSPLLLAAGKLAVGTLVVALLYPLLHIRLRRSSAVYSGAALVLLLLGAVVSGAVSVILSTFFVIAFVFGFIFSLARPAWLKALALAGALAPGLYLLVALAAVADASMAEALLRPPFWREVVTALLLLPLLLMVFRLAALVPRVPLLPLIVLASLIGAALVSAAVIVDARTEQPAEISVEERFPATAEGYVDGTPTTAEVDISASRRFPREGSVVPGVEVAVEGGWIDRVSCPYFPCSVTADAPTAPFTFAVEQSAALERETLTWSVAFAEPATDLHVVVESDAPVQLYASSLPTEEAVGSTGREFHLRPGPVPPSTVSGTIVLRAAEDPTAPGRQPVMITVRAEARFDRSEESRIIGVPTQEDARLTHYGSLWTLQERLVIP